MKQTIPRKESSVTYVSSDDTCSIDSSFEEEMKALENTKQDTIEDLKYKHNQYENFKKKLYQKRQELEQDKTSSMWSSLYYTFFNNHTKNAITLNELELRCKFLFNMEKYDQVKDSDKAKKIIPFTNIAELIKTFGEKKQENTLKVFSEQKKNPRRRSEGKRGSITKLDHEKKKYSLTPSLPKRGLVDILSLYNIEKTNEIISSINKNTNDQETNDDIRARVENMNHILNNKNSYQIELEQLNDISKGNKEVKRMIKEYLDTKSNEKFFMENTDVNLIEKFDGKLEEEEKLAKKVNMFTHKIIGKFATSDKLDF